MNWYKQADFMGRDPYSVDFAYEESKANKMETDSLLGALSDAIEASQTSINQGKYTDQASVYRKELLSRGMSIPEQDAAINKIPSFHFNPEETKPAKDPKQKRETVENHNPKDHTFNYYPKFQLDPGMTTAKVLRTSKRKKLAQDFNLNNVDSEEDFISKQNEALSSQINSFIYDLYTQNPSLDLDQLFNETLDQFLDEEDFVNAPEYAERVQKLIKLEIAGQEKARRDSEDADAQSAYEAEMGRDTYLNHRDGYQV